MYVFWGNNKESKITESEDKAENVIYLLLFFLFFVSFLFSLPLFLFFCFLLFFLSFLLFLSLFLSLLFSPFPFLFSPFPFLFPSLLFFLSSLLSFSLSLFSSVLFSPFHSLSFSFSLIFSPFISLLFRLRLSPSLPVLYLQSYLQFPFILIFPFHSIPLARDSSPTPQPPSRHPSPPDARDKSASFRLNKDISTASSFVMNARRG